MVRGGKIELKNSPERGKSALGEDEAGQGGIIPNIFIFGETFEGFCCCCWRGGSSSNSASAGKTQKSGKKGGKKRNFSAVGAKIGVKSQILRPGREIWGRNGENRGGIHPKNEGKEGKKGGGRRGAAPSPPPRPRRVRGQTQTP